MTLHRHCVLAIGAMGIASPLWAQTVPVAPTHAGTLLEQQRRLSPSMEPQAVPPGVLPAAPVAARAAPAAGTHTTVLRFQVDGSSLVDAAAVHAVLAPWLHRPVGLADLREATAAVEALYRQRGWLARVSLPGQDITDGTVRFIVTESRLGRVVVQPGDPAPAARLRTRVQNLLAAHLPAGQPLNLAALERALLLANDMPGVRVNGSLQASDTPGSTDVVVLLGASVPYRGEASLDNGGHRATGSERASAQVSLLSPLGLGESISLAGSTSRGSQYLSLGASAPLPGALGDQGWRMAGTASVLRYQVQDARNTTTGLPPEGSSSSLGASVQYPLVRTAVGQWLLSTGYAQTTLRNRDDNQAPGILETTGRARSRALQLGLSGYQFDQGGGASSASVVWSAGRLRLDGSPASAITADSQTLATQGRFSKLRWSASRLQTLQPGLSLLGSATGQWASRNLDPSEKMYLGGMHGVRAYPNAEGGGSTGIQASVELRQDLGAQWQASSFYDWGQVQQYKHNRYASNSAIPLLAHNRARLQGTGLALTWRGPQGLHIQGTWAHRIGNNPLATPSGADTDGSLHKNRFWLHASMAF